jgi:hypothetical protein
LSLRFKSETDFRLWLLRKGTSDSEIQRILGEECVVLQASSQRGASSSVETLDPLLRSRLRLQMMRDAKARAAIALAAPAGRGDGFLATLRRWITKNTVR